MVINQSFDPLFFTIMNFSKGSGYTSVASHVIFGPTDNQIVMR